MHPNVKKFHRENGDKYVVINDGQHIVFANGASRETGEWGRMDDPPESLRERIGMMLVYWQVLYDRAAKVFNDARDDVLNNPSLDETPEEVVARLKKLKAIAVGHRTKISELKHQLQQRPRARRDAEGARMEAEIAAQQATVKAAAVKVKL